MACWPKTAREPSADHAASKVLDEGRDRTSGDREDSRLDGFALRADFSVPDDEEVRRRSLRREIAVTGDP